MKSTKIFDTWT